MMVFRHIWLAAVACALLMGALSHAADTEISFSKTTYWADDVTLTLEWNCQDLLTTTENDQLAIILPPGFRKSASAPSGIGGNQMRCHFTTGSTSPTTIPTRLKTQGFEDNDGMIALIVDEKVRFVDTCTVTCSHLTNFPRPMDAAGWTYTVEYDSDVAEVKRVFAETRPLPAFTIPVFAPTVVTSTQTGALNVPFSARASAPLTFSAGQRGPELVAGQMFVFAFSDPWLQTHTSLSHVELTVTVDGNKEVVLKGASREGHTLYVPVTAEALESAPAEITSPYAYRLPMVLRLRGYARPRRIVATQTEHIGVTRLHSTNDDIASENKNFLLPTITSAPLKSYQVLPLVPLAGSRGSLTVKVTYPNMDILAKDTITLALPAAERSPWSFQAGQVRHNCFINGVATTSANIAVFSSSRSQLSVTVGANVLNKVADDSFNTLEIKCEGVNLPTKAIAAVDVLTGVISSPGFILMNGDVGVCAALPTRGQLGEKKTAKFTLSSDISATQSDLTVTTGKLGVLTVSAGDAFDIVLPTGFTYTTDLKCKLTVDDSDTPVPSTTVLTKAQNFKPLLETIRVTIGKKIDDPKEKEIKIVCETVLLPSYGREAQRDGVMRLIYFGDSLPSSSNREEFVAAELTDALTSEFSPTTALGTSRRRLTYSGIASPVAGAVSSIDVEVWPLVGKSSDAPAGSDEDTDVEITLAAGVAIELIFPASEVNASAPTACDLSINVADAETSFANRVAVDTSATMLTGFNQLAPTKTFARIRVRTQRPLTLSADLRRRRASIKCTNIRLPAYGQSPSNVGVLTLVNLDDLPMSRRSDMEVSAVIPPTMTGQITPKGSTLMAGRDATFDIRIVSTLGISAALIEQHDEDYFAIEVTFPTGYSVDTTRIITCSADRANDWHPIVRVNNDRNLPTFRFNLKSSFAAIGARQPFTTTCKFISLPSVHSNNRRGTWTVRLLSSPLNDIVGVASGEVGPITAADYQTEFGGITRDVSYSSVSGSSVSVAAILSPAAPIKKDSSEEDSKVALVIYLPDSFDIAPGEYPEGALNPNGSPAISCFVKDEGVLNAPQIKGDVEVEIATSDDLELSNYPGARVVKVSFYPASDFVPESGNVFEKIRFECGSLPIPDRDLPEMRDGYIGVTGTSMAVRQTSTNIAKMAAFNRVQVALTSFRTRFEPNSLGTVGTYIAEIDGIQSVVGTTMLIPVPPGTQIGDEEKPIVCEVTKRQRVEGTTDEYTTVRTHTFTSATLPYPFDSIHASPVVDALGAIKNDIVTLSCKNVRAPSSPNAVTGMQSTVIDAKGDVKFRTTTVSFAQLGPRIMEGTPSLLLNPSYKDTPTTLALEFEVLPIDIIAGDKILFDLPDGVSRTVHTRCMINGAQVNSFRVLCPGKDKDKDGNPIYQACAAMSTTNPEDPSATIKNRRMEVGVSNTVTPASLRGGVTPVKCVFMTTPKTIASETDTLKLEVVSSNGNVRASTKKLAFGGVLSDRLGDLNLAVEFSVPYSLEESTLSYNVAPLTELRNTDSLELIFPVIYDVSPTSNTACSITLTRPGVPTSRMDAKYTFSFDSNTKNPRLQVSPTATVAATGSNGVLTVECKEMRTPRTFTAATVGRLELYRGGSPTPASVNADVSLPQIDYTPLASEFAFLMPGKSRLADTETESLMLTLKPIPLVMKKFSGIEFVVPYGGFRLRVNASGDIQEPECKYLYQSGIMGTWVEVRGHTEVVATSSSLTVRFVASNSGLISKSATLSKLMCAPIDVPISPHPRTTNIVAVGLLPRNESINTVTDDFIYSMRQTAVEMPAIMTEAESKLVDTFVQLSLTITGVVAPVTPQRFTELAGTFQATVIASGGPIEVNVKPIRQSAHQVGPNDYAVSLSFRASRPLSAADTVEAFLDRIVLIRNDIEQSLRKETRGLAVSAGGVTLVDTPKTCEDGVRNARETGVDCGGDECKQCEVNQQCQRDSDCLTTLCSPSTRVCTSLSVKTSAAPAGAAPVWALVVATVIAAVAAAISAA